MDTRIDGAHLESVAHECADATASARPREIPRDEVEGHVARAIGVRVGEDVIEGPRVIEGGEDEPAARAEPRLFGGSERGGGADIRQRGDAAWGDAEPGATRDEIAA